MIDRQRLLVHPYARGTFISAAVRILHRKTEIFDPGGTSFTGVQILRDKPALSDNAADTGGAILASRPVRSTMGEYIKMANSERDAQIGGILWKWRPATETETIGSDAIYIPRWESSYFFILNV